ncbi:hypothetical protein RchiOBHm_Chr4g0410711 [Rosa chinensis]|uniref:Uncharacterized protein n=1 Tax=Rosa chinensis TaxID=74649 RepID=A0A2P6QVF9_ROSCH|nr:hypothetical protein RchiOBHm_Chr4g0410711 [Rosa chinensis]
MTTVCSIFSNCILHFVSCWVCQKLKFIKKDQKFLVLNHLFQLNCVLNCLNVI